MISYMDVFFVLKLAVLIALVVAFLLSVALILKRVKNRSEPSDIPSTVEAPAVEVHADDLAGSGAELAAKQDKPEVCQAVEFLDSVDNHSHDKPDFGPNAMPKPEMQRQSRPFADKSPKSKQSVKSDSSDFLQALLSINTDSELYQRSSGLLTATEQQVFRDLRSAGGMATQVFCKVPVLDVLSSKEGHDFRPHREVINILSTQYFSFVVCLQGSLDIVGVAEVFDRHSRFLDRDKGRLKILKTVARKAGVPMTVLDTAKGYSLLQLKHQVGSLIDCEKNLSEVKAGRLGYTFLTNTDPVKKSTAHKQPPSAMSPSCPSCGDSMTYRVSRVGKYKGQVFHVCQSYPQCRHIVREPTATHASDWTANLQQKQPV